MTYRDREVLIQAALARIEAGESVRSIARTEGMPDERTLRTWLAETPQYARAREIGWQTVADDLIEIADDGRNDWMDRELRDGSTIRVVDREVVERSRLRLDTRKWLLSKMLPKVYGDRIQVDTTTTTRVLVAFSRLGGRVDGEEIQAPTALPALPAPTPAAPNTPPDRVDGA